MLNKTSLAAALSVAMALPFAAGASTLNLSNTIVDGGSYDMVGAWFFAEAFQREDDAGSREFTFMNLSTISQNIMLTSTTVNTLSAMFQGGITFEWLQSGLTQFVSQGTTSFSGILDNTIGANGSDTLRVTFGDPRRRDNGSVNDTAHFSVAFDSSVAAVPLPAGGVLLISAIAGIAAMRRRRKAA
jgi:hypothetical protein